MVLEPSDGQPLAAALLGQFIVLRLRPAPDAPALLRSYSLSSEPRDDRYRLSIKREPHGAAGSYVETQVRTGDVLDASAPRGSFTLRPGDGPVIFLPRLGMAAWNRDRLQVMRDHERSAADKPV